MRILMLNTYDFRGGAARATWRLYRGLKEQAVDVNLLVQEKQSEDAGVVVAKAPFPFFVNTLRPYIDFAIPLMQTRQRVLFSTALLSDNLAGVINRINPDVVHLNWITGGFIRLETLADIRQPVVWTLHDMWAFTGGCHNTTDCTRYQSACGKCPLLHSSRENDLSNRVFHRKLATYAAMKNLTMTAPSRWLSQQIGESRLLGNRKVHVAFNGLDTRAFRPVDQAEARRRLGLSPRKKTVVFGAIRATETPLKGFSLLTEALKILNRNDLQLVVFGSSGPAATDISGLDVTFTGPVAEHEKLVDLYSAADVVAVPSYQEVFGQAASEAQACGTPVVAFACTGLLDIVRHKETGYLAPPYEPAGLAQGIGWVIGDDQRLVQLGMASREHAVKNFDIAGIAKQYIRIYQEAIDGKNQ